MQVVDESSQNLRTSEVTYTEKHCEVNGSPDISQLSSSFFRNRDLGGDEEKSNRHKPSRKN